MSTVAPSPDEAGRRAVDAARKTLASAQRQHAARMAALARARRALAALRARYGEADRRTRAAQTTYETALGELRAARDAVGTAKATVADGLAAALPVGVTDEVARLTADVPIVMFPVRLETRFARGHADARFAGRLQLRIYPDAVAADNHEPLLTEKERDAGRDYWRKAWADADERDAWTALLKETTPTRAAWIVRVTAPTNLGAFPAEPPPGAGPPGPEPEFPEVGTRADNWTSRTEARLLPDRWLVLAYRRFPPQDPADVLRAESRPVEEPLALTLRLSTDGPEDLLDDSIPLSDDGLTVDPELMWTFDFPRAVAAGMAVELDLTAADLDRGFARVLVLGVKSSLSPTEAAERLGALIDSHRYARGFALVPQGTPTNNTSGAAAGYPAPDPNGELSFAVERDSARSIAGRDGERVARALGVASAHLLHVAGAERDEQAPARTMADALWPATIGYFLEQLMGPHFDGGALAAAREYFVTSVRGRGPLPAFRVGDVPYGLLPVMSLTHWRVARDAAGPARHLPPLLGRLRDTWLAAATQAPRINRTADADGDLIDALALDASARQAYVRACLGPETQANTISFLGIEIPTWAQLQEQIEAALLAAAGLGPEWAARVARLSYADRSEQFRFGFVLNDPEAPLSERDALAFDYVNWIRNADPDTLRSERFPEGAERPQALLYLMLRHAFLTEYARHGRQILVRQKMLAADELWEHELVGVVPQQLTAATARAPSDFAAIGTATGATAAPVPPPGPAPPTPTVATYRPTIWERLNQSVTGVTSGESLGRFLGRSRATPRVPEDASLDAYRASLAALVGLPTAELDRLFSETLDVCSHRLDAWITSVAWQRLERMRTQNPDGCHLGAFGWVEDLEADPPPTRRVVRLGERREVSARIDESGGHVYAPSMNHAAAAAVLRSGYLTRSGEQARPYAVDLSSSRVRTALWFMDTVRDGQPLGAALGYHLERGLHERHAPLELDKFIDDFRNRYPLVANKTTDSGEPAESIAARNVVDGLALRRAWQKTLSGAPDGIPWGDLAPTPTPDERAAIEAELRGLDDIVDAITDVLMAESVYQTVRGSVEGTAASLDTMAKGVRAPEPEVVRTPRGGTDLYHRVALVLAGDPPVVPPWAVPARTPRALVEPYLNAWAAQLLPAPGSVVCTATFPDPANPAARLAQSVTLAMLGLEPIDVLALALSMDTDPGGSDFGRRIARESELHARIVFAVTAARPTDRIDVDFEAADPALGQRTFHELLEIARAINAALASARTLAPADLLPPEQSAKAESADLMAAELATRAGLALGRLTAARDALDTALTTIRDAPGGTDPSLTALRAALADAALLGVAGAFPLSRAGDAPAERAQLVGPGESVLKELRRRHAATLAELDPVAAIQAALGRRFLVIPRFVPASADDAAAQLDEALGQPPDLGAEPTQVLGRWFAQCARVRRPLGEWRMLDLYAGTAGRRLTDFTVVQLPHVPGAPWVGLPFADEAQRPSAGRVSMLLRRAASPAATQPWAGLLLDEWTERIPNREEDAAVAFHHDSPNAAAPQGVLIVVPGIVAAARERDGARWSLEQLAAALNDTLDVAKMRAVEGDKLGVLAQALPMTYLAANAADDTISTSFVGKLVAQAVIAQVQT
jgi:hypothetical protein